MAEKNEKKFVLEKDGHRVETTLPSEAVAFKSRGYKLVNQAATGDESKSARPATKK